MTRLEFVARWTARREDLLRLGAMVNGGATCLEVLADFEAVMTAEADELLDLRSAATHSGYSTDHLRRLHRQGSLRAERRGRRLYFLVKDLPKKSRQIDVPTPVAYDAAADARQVATRRS